MTVFTVVITLAGTTFISHGNNLCNAVNKVVDAQVQILSRSSALVDRSTVYKNEQQKEAAHKFYQEIIADEEAARCKE